MIDTVQTIMTHMMCIWTFKCYFFSFFVNKFFIPIKVSLFALYSQMCSLTTVLFKIILSTDICYFLITQKYLISAYQHFPVQSTMPFHLWRYWPLFLKGEDRKKKNTPFSTADDFADGCRTSSTTWTYSVQVSLS